MGGQKPADVFSILGGLEPRNSLRRTVWRLIWSTPLLSLAAVLLIAGLNGGLEYIAPMDATGVRERHATKDSMPGRMPLQPEAAPHFAPVADRAMIVSEAPDDDAARAADGIVSKEKNENEARPGPLIAQGNASHGDKRAGGEAPASAPDRVIAAQVPSASAALIPPAAKARKAPRDKDVDLIAALLSHAAAPGATATGKAPAGKPQPKPAARRAAPVPAVSRHARDAATNRDIVTRVKDESTESLVQRCRALGFLEGELCRLRVCSGLWGKEPACPSSTPASPDY